jgi:hypothetical protein
MASIFKKGTGLMPIPSKTIQVIATETFNAALGGVEVVRFVKGQVFPRPLQMAEVEPWLKSGKLKEHKPAASKPAAPAGLPDGPALEAMSKEDLVKQAEAEKVEIDARKSKADIARAILEARTA